MNACFPRINGRTIKHSAIEMSANGWRVVPFKPDRSRAFVKYADVPARNPDQVANDWERWPEALLAIHLPRNIVVLDIDPRNGTTLDQITAQLTDRFALPDCPTVSTPKGGLHLWFSLPKGQSARNWTSLHNRFPIKGVDIRGYRGLAILPPSRRADGDYRWAHWQSSIPLAPPPLIKALSIREADPGPPARPQPFVGDEISPYAQAVLRGEFERVAHAASGSRNHALFVASARLSSFHAGGHIPDVRVNLQNMARLNELVADDGLASVIATIQSGWKHGAKRPASVPGAEQWPS